ncbi:uncharacterized protein [Apostichopus japonicus]|uniref:uncharacterized protein n=1 Tax=Stichopus japonicus TaxID=307972 RepID=UPI003AB8E7E0
MPATVIILLCVSVTSLLALDSVSDNPRCMHTQYAILGEVGQLSCHPFLKYETVQWYFENGTKPVAYRVRNITHQSGNTEYYDVLLDGSLVIPNVTRANEGLYKLRIISAETIKLYNITLVVVDPPDFPIIQIDGCKAYEDCVIQTKETNIVKCSVQNFRVNVNLTVTDPSQILTYTKQKVNETNGIYSTALTFEFDLSGDKRCQTDVYLFCNTSGVLPEFASVRQIAIRSDPEECSKEPGPIFALSVMFIFFLLIGLVIGGQIMVARRKEKRRKRRNETMQYSLIPNE